MNSSSSEDDANIQGISSVEKDTTAEKRKLLRDIQELQSIIKQYELHVDTVCFRNVEEHIEKHTTKLQTLRSEENISNSVSNIEADLQNELYNLAGFNCIKSRRNEVIFNFTTTNELQENNTYAVQIFIKDGKGFLGKWVMPMSINMNNILTKTPIDKLQNINVFLKNCQRHINCYVVRKEQYLKLMKHTSNIKHCKLQSNIGYTQVNLELYGIDDTQTDECLNLIIYIMYHSDEARPHKVEVDTINQDKLSSDRRQRLKVYLKQFKTLDLTTAFNQMLADDNSEFIWIKEDDSGSPLELNDISSSDEEGFLTEILSNRKKSLRNIKKKHKLQKKWKEIKRQKGASFTTTKNITLSEDDVEDNIEDNRSKVKVSYIQQNNSTRKKKEGVASTSNLKEATPRKPEVRLKQTKLNFQAMQNASSGSVNKNSLIKSELRNKPGGKSRTIKPVTSTPLVRRNINTRSSSSPNSNIGNISNIEKLKRRQKMKML